MSGKQDWETPWFLFNKLDKHFNFTIDGAARADNAKCSAFISPEDNAHKIELFNEVIFCNPPYSNMEPWVDTFIRWSKENTVVALIQDRTDTLWWARLFPHCLEIVFLTGRINFIGTVTGNNRGAAVIVLGDRRETSVRMWNWQSSEF